MIVLDSLICKELELTYWQLHEINPVQKFTINRQEKELLRKILIAKSVTLTDSLIEVPSQDIVVVKLPKITLTFNNINNNDSETHINLPKLSDMLNNQHSKKETWYKLKDKTLL